MATKKKSRVKSTRKKKRIVKKASKKKPVKKLTKTKSKKPVKKLVKAKSKKSVKKPKAKPVKKKRKKKLVTRPAFEGRKRQPEFSPPEGFDIKLTATTVDEAYATIEARLNDAKDQLPQGYDGKVMLHVYADGSVDGELYVKVPRGLSTGDVELEMYEAFEQVAVGQRYWISSGARYKVETDDERYKRFKGMTQVSTNYQRAVRANIVEEHLIVQEKLIKGMDRSFGQEAHSVFIRLHWNPEDIKPKR